MKRLLAILILLAPCIVMASGGMQPVGSVYIGGEEPGGAYTDTFDANINNWTSIGPVTYAWYEIGVMICTATGSTQHSAAYFETQLSGVKQAMKVEIVAAEDNTPYTGVIFRRTGGAGEKFYRVIANPGDTNVYWSYCTDDADLLPSADIATDDMTGDWDEGDWLGVEVSGTGDDTVVNVWRWTNDPGEYDESYTNWGVPGVAGDTIVFTTNPSANACDTGLYTGVYTFNPTTAKSTAYDNWYVISP